MAAMPIYGKNLLKIFSRTISQMTLKLGTQQQGLEPYKVCVNDDPWLTLTYFTTRSTLFIKALTFENLDKKYIKSKFKEMFLKLTANG